MPLPSGAKTVDICYSPDLERQGSPVQFDFESLITFTDPLDLATCSLADLRTLRGHYQEVENGLSYARRIIQGRLDTVAAELDRRSEGSDGESVLSRLPEALAAHSRAPGVPRPVGELEPPEWASEITDELDGILTPSDLGGLADLDFQNLTAAAEEIGLLEREVSEFRHDIHRRIDRVQDELVSRYRSGAKVDDLLKTD